MWTLSVLALLAGGAQAQTGPSTASVADIEAMARCDPADTETAGPVCMDQIIFEGNPKAAECSEYRSTCEEAAGRICTGTLNKYEVFPVPNRDDKLYKKEQTASCTGSGGTCVAEGVCSKGVMVDCQCSPATKEVTYQGCFVDQSTRTLSTTAESFDDMTPTKCADLCGNNFPAFGVEWSKECFCGTDNDYNALEAKRSEESQCSSECGGALRDWQPSGTAPGVTAWNGKCGGSWRLSVFSQDPKCDGVEFVEDGNGGATCKVTSRAVGGSVSGADIVCSQKAEDKLKAGGAKQVVVRGLAKPDGSFSVAQCPKNYMATGCSCLGTTCDGARSGWMPHSNKILPDGACVAFPRKGSSQTVEAMALCTPLEAVSMASTIDTLEFCISNGCRDNAARANVLLARAATILGPRINHYANKVTDVVCPEVEAGENQENHGLGVIPADSAIAVVLIIWLFTAALIGGCGFTFCKPAQ